MFSQKHSFRAKSHKPVKSRLICLLCFGCSIFEIIGHFNTSKIESVSDVEFLGRIYLVCFKIVVLLCRLLRNFITI